MHPLLARYLSPDTTRDALERLERGEPPRDAGEAALAGAVRVHPDAARAVRGEEALPPSDTEAALVLLAAHAAARSLDDDEALGPAARRAREALGREGASEEETDAFLASILLEEAFGEEQEVDTFDRRFVEETLGEVPALAALTRERVDALLERFEAEGEGRVEQHLRGRLARALLETAWADGPQPINPEHVEALLAEQVEGRPARDRELALATLVALLERLAAEGLVGPSRLARLKQQLGDEPPAGEDDDEEAWPDEEQDEEPPAGA